MVSLLKYVDMQSRSTAFVAYCIYISLSVAGVKKNVLLLIGTVVQPTIR